MLSYNDIIRSLKHQIGSLGCISGNFCVFEINARTSDYNMALEAPQTNAHSQRAAPVSAKVCGYESQARSCSACSLEN